MKTQWSALEGQKANQSPDAQEAWKKLQGRLVQDDLIPEQNKSKGKNLGSYVLRIAAAIALLIGVSAVVYLSVHKAKSQIEMVSLNTGTDANTLIKTLDDGSVVYIAQNTMFSFPVAFQPESRNVALNGEAFFDIAPNPQKPFIIETREAYIQVLGTAFNVKADEGKGFELIVDRGKVKVTLKINPSQSEFVVAGEKLTTLHNSIVKTKQLAGEFGYWYKHRMHFKDEMLQNIITVLNRNFNTTFVLGEKEIGTRKLTVTFNNETPETMSELLCAALNLKSQTINGSVVLSDNKAGAK